MSGLWDLDGYDVEVMLGFGAAGEVWRARDRATGELVALKRLRTPADPQVLEALARLDTPYAVRLRAVVDDVLVLDHVAGGSLTGLLARRGRLDPGEVVTVAVPVATALAAAHAVGLAHGGLSPADVLLTPDGMPLLADLGLSALPADPADDVRALAALCRLMLAGSPPDPSPGTDLPRPLGASSPQGASPPGLDLPPALLAAVAAGLAGGPGCPDAAAFGSLLRRSHPSAPLRLTGGVAPRPSASPLPGPGLRAAAEAAVRAAPAGRGSERGRPGPDVSVPPSGRPARRRPDPAEGAVARPVASPRHRSASGFAHGTVSRVPRAAWLVLLVVLAATVGWVSGRGQLAGAAAVAPLTTSPVPAAPASPTALPSVPVSSTARPVREAAWAAVLDGLDLARARAFATADPAALQQVWAAGSDGARADAAAVNGLRGAGRSAHGLRHAVRAVDVVTATAVRAELRVVDVLGDHEVRGAGGQVVGRVAARGSATWRVVLTRTPSGWRLVSVQPD